VDLPHSPLPDLPAAQRRVKRQSRARSARPRRAAMRPKGRATPSGFAIYAGLRLGELLVLDIAAVDLLGVRGDHDRP